MSLATAVPGMLWAQEIILNALGAHVHVHSILIWGGIATAVMTAMMSAAQEFGWSRLGLPYLLGAAFTASRSRARVVGFAVHFLNGWVFAFLYAVVFEDLARTGWWLGALLGLLHAVLLLLLAVPLIPTIHPRMAGRSSGPTPTRWLQPPGFLALNYGRQTPLVVVASHLAYGMIIGGFYELVPPG